MKLEGDAVPGTLAEASVFFQDSPDLLLLLRLLALGQGAWDLIDSQVFKEPKMVWGLLSSFSTNYEE